MKRYMLLLTLVMLLISSYTVSARLDTDYVDCLSKRILKDCENQKIIISNEVFNELGYNEKTQKSNLVLIDIINNFSYPKTNLYIKLNGFTYCCSHKILF